MRRLMLGLVMISTVSISYAFPGFSVCNFGKEDVASVMCYGPTVLEATNVQGDIKVAGPVRANSITAGAIVITGTVNFTNSTINGPAEITGHLTATNVNFQEGIKATSDNLQFNHSAINGDITVSSESNAPYVAIECGTTVTGNIVFVGMSGTVRITGDSSVRGEVINGKAQFVKETCKTKT